MRKLVFTEQLVIDNGSIHKYEYQVFQVSDCPDFELVRYAYGALQMKNPIYRGLDRVLFEINSDKEKKIRFLQEVYRQ